MKDSDYIKYAEAKIAVLEYELRQEKERSTEIKTVEAKEIDIMHTLPEFSNVELQALRRRAGLTAIKAATLAGMARSTLAGFEKGLRAPSYKNVKILTDIYVGIINNI